MVLEGRHEPQLVSIQTSFICPSPPPRPDESLRHLNLTRMSRNSGSVIVSTPQDPELYVCESSTGDVIAAGGGRLLQETVMHYDMSASEHDSGSDRNHTSGLHQFTSTDETHSQQLLDGIRFVQKITNDNESIQTNKTQLKQGQTSVVGRRLCGSHLSSEVLDVRRRRVHVWSILQENDSTRSRSSPLYQTSGRVNHLVRFPRW
ncbi:Hypothetical protein SMAX5B_013757 [Scophthalmus maximus]|uniref:Uncharacterized protein n=1 Tax=Scophthalmus maximus TaxID=52904 RepID=A0A2U9C1R3_SCOMX|nr:Hypothetical protein SMAX5B_013757 [Scophthalmus maximus]